MDHSIFVHSTKDGTFCIIALYVDDLMILSNDSITLGHRKDKLMRTFKMKDLRPIHWFLGLEIIHDRSHCLISVSQTRYDTDIMTILILLTPIPFPLLSQQILNSLNLMLLKLTPASTNLTLV